MTLEITNLPGSLIGPRDATRPVNKARAAHLAESIREVGLLSPIIVAPGKRYRNGSKVDGWDILAGQHRFHAMFDILNWREIPCVVCGLGDLEAQLVTIDENLIRHELTPAERAHQTARRKEIYETLHPQTKQGASQAAGMNRSVGRGRQNGGDVKTFTRSTAEATGQSERAVQRDARRGEQLADVLPRISGTNLDKPSELDALMQLQSVEREDVIRQVERGGRVSAKSLLKRAEGAIEKRDAQSRPAGHHEVDLKRQLADKTEKLRSLQSRKQGADAHNRQLIAELRTKTNECVRLNETIANLREENRRLIKRLIRKDPEAQADTGSGSCEPLV